MYKAVFIDLDGTLLRNDHSISETTISVIDRLQKKNILVVLVSARPLHGILPISKEIGLLHLPVASLNGAYIVLGEEILINSVIDINTVVKLDELLDKKVLAIIYYQQMQWFASTCNIETDNEQVITEVPLVIQPFSDTLAEWQKTTNGPNKILLIAPPETINAIQNKLQPLFFNQLNIYTSKPNYLEIMNIHASKTNAVKFFISRYNIKREEIIAIGDNFNDKEMLEFAGKGIAMGNAPDEVKAVADYVTDTNNNDGVAKALVKFMDI